MNLHRKAHLIRTFLLRMLHRHGFGIQSPWAYEMVRDVLFEQLHYYAYEDQGLRTQSQQQLFRIKNHFSPHLVVVIDKVGNEAESMYRHAIENATPQMALVIEHIDDDNACLWQCAIGDARAIVTFDMGSRGLVTFDNKRIKQNYLL